MTDGPKAFYRVSELAKAAGLSKYEVRKLAREAGCPVLPWGQAHIIYYSDLLRFMPGFMDTIEARFAAMQEE